MSSEPTWFWTRALSALVAERRIYIRSDGKTRYVAIRPAAQIGGAFAVAALLGWSGFVTSAFVTNALDGRNTRIQIEVLTEAYEARLATYGAQYKNLEEQLDRANQRRDVVTEKLSAKQMQLVDTANNLREAATELTVLRENFEIMLASQRDEAIRTDKLDSELTLSRDALADARTSMDDFDGTLESLSGAMEQVIAERDLAAGNSARLGGEVARLAGAIDRLNDRQERLLSQLETAARTSFAGLETIFDRSDIDLERILTIAKRDYSGSGGPFSPIDDEREAESGIEDTRVASLMTDLENVNLMRFAAERLPFGEPVQGGRLTSTFGPRRDPKGRGRSLHTGLDIAAPRGTPIYATAAGVVTFAGRQRGYGIVVKIRHAFGFETFYAHNSRARVKVGQRVSRGDRIADIGSTGRSTGNHVHYEIRIDSEPVNPSKFIEAVRDVL